MPQCDPRAEAQAGRRGRYRGLGARSLGSQGSDACRDRLAAGGGDLRARILKENVEDEAHSTTRFVVLSREKKWAKPGNGKTITTFVFRVRNVPAALYKALGGFATNGVNMTKLESYMVGGNFFATQFYADVEGHPDDARWSSRSRSSPSSPRNDRARRLSRASFPPDVQGREGLGVTRRRGRGTPRCHAGGLLPRLRRFPTLAALARRAAGITDRPRDLLEDGDHALGPVRGARHVVRDLIGCAVLLLQRSATAEV